MADDDILSTGSKIIDDLISKRVEFSKSHGPETTIKTNLWVRLLDKAIKDGGAVAFDLEMSPDPELAKKLGVDS